MADLTPTQDKTILDHIRVLRRRKWFVVAAVLTAVGVAVVITTQATRIYAARADVLLSTSEDESPFEREGGPAADPTLVDTQVQVLKSRPVAEETRRRLGQDARRIESVNVSQVGRTRILRVEVESADPGLAKRAADTFAAVYVEQRREAAINSALEVGRQVLQKAEEARTQLDEIDSRLAIARAAKPANVAEIEKLEAQREPIATQYAAFRQKYDQVQVDAQLRRGGVELLAKASVPATPVRPAPLRNIALALALGLCLGVGVAFLVDFLDDTIRSPDDIERQVRGLSILATIPAVTDWKNRDRAKLIAVETPSDVVSEAYRSLRTSLQFIGLRQPLRTLLVTSPMASEGKTTTLANLAVTMARAGFRVICVDCDLRRPRLHEFFGIDNARGFTSVLLGDHPLSAALAEVPLGTGGSLRVLSSGPLPPNPAELLGTARVAELLQAMDAEADYVLLDAPPLLPITDAVVLSSRVDGVVLVATSRVTSRRHLSRAVALLAQAGANALGVVANGTGPDSGYGYGYRYRYRSDSPPRDITSSDDPNSLSAGASR